MKKVVSRLSFISLQGLCCTAAWHLVTNSYAQDISATQTGLSLAAPYSELRMSHVVEGSQRPDDTLKNVPRLRLQPTVGVKFPDLALNVYAVGYFDRMTETSTLEQHKQARFYVESEGIPFGNFKVAPYALYQMPLKDKDPKILLASVQSYSPSLPTTIGVLTPSVGVELGAYFDTKPQEAKYRLASNENPDNQLRLHELRRDEGGEVYGKKKGQDFYHEWFAGLGMTPAFSSALTISLTSWISNNYSPSYTVTAANKVEKGYPVSTSTSERLRIAYKVNENFTLRNDFVSYQGGLYESSQGTDTNMVNEFQIIYKFL